MPARERVHERVLEGVAHVQRAGDVRRRQHDAVGLRRHRRARMLRKIPNVRRSGARCRRGVGLVHEGPDYTGRCGAMGWPLDWRRIRIPGESVMRILASCVAIVALLSTAAAAADTGSGVVNTVRADIDSMYPDIEKLYIDLHQNPELSLLEEKTAAKLAERMRKLGYEVTTQVGGTGIVALLEERRGSDAAGPHRHGCAAGARADRAAIRQQGDQKDAVTGEIVPVMHACGHDVHMAAWIGTATILAKRKDLWRGTVMFVGQPAEERIRGAKAMLADGLYTRFGKPDVALGIHDHDMTPAGRWV